ncbi:3-hydroxyacyl-CoA dehydrogenase family protein [Chloroflexota bacterium]
MEIKRIAILGAGAMGHGITQVCAQGGFQVTLEDIKDEFVQSGLDKIKKFLQGGVERGKLTQDDADAVLGRIKTSTDLADAGKDADLVLEAIVEDMKIKSDTFRQLDQTCPNHTMFASNTSYQSITEIAAATKRPDKFVGIHWFNPPQIMRGVEVVKTEKTSQETLDIIVDFCRKVGKEPTVCMDSPGFIANRILQIWRNEAFKLYDEGAASFQDVDKAFKAAYNFRMGPFELADMAGLEIALKGNETFYSELKREIFKPPRSLVTKVRAGDYGRKTGRGFYEYK